VSVRSIIAHFTAWFIPASVCACSNNERRRAQVIMWFWLAVLFWAPVYCGLYYYLGCMLAVRAVLIATLLAVTVPLSLRITGSVCVAGNFFTLVLFTLLLSLILLTGGDNSPVRVWLVLIPILSAVLAGLKSSIIWTTLTVAIRLSFEFLQYRGFDLASELTSDGQHVLNVLSLTSLLVLVGVFAWSYEYLQRRTFNEIEDRANALRKNEALLTNVLATIPYHVFWKDRDSRFLGCNQRFAEAAGLNHPVEIIGKSDYDLLWSRQESDHYRACDRIVMECGEAMLNVEEINHQADGLERVLLTSRVPLRDSSGTVMGILGVFTDITEQKRLEHQLKLQGSALAAIANAVVITDSSGNIVWVNPAFSELTGYTREEVVGKSPAMLKSGQHDAAFYRQLWSTINSGAVWQGEIINRRKDGSLYHEDMTVTPVRDSDNRITHFVAIKQDITDRLRAERLANERDRLRDSVKAHEHLIGVVGHELRTPLAGLMIIAEFLQHSSDRNTAEFDSFLGSVLEEVQRMSGTVNDLLEVARLDSGIAKWNWGEVDVHKTCSEAAASIRPLIDATQISLTVHVQSEELAMYGDAAAIRRLLINLLSNASKHTTEGAITLDARVDEDADGRWIDFVVTDTGTGMTPETAARLGEAFALNSGVVGEKYVTGSGLGLAICRGIVTAHGGTIRVKSRLNEGTTCYVRLRGDLPAPSKPERLVEIAAEA